MEIQMVDRMIYQNLRNGLINAVGYVSVTFFDQNLSTNLTVIN